MWGSTPPSPPAARRLRDRLLLLIYEHELDAEEVKRYPIQFCGTTSLRKSSRAQVEKLVRHLEQVAAQRREQLLDEITVSSGAPSEAGKEAA